MMGARRTISECCWSRRTGTAVQNMLKKGQSQNDVHIAEIFNQPKTAVTPSRVGLTLGLLFDMSRRWRTLKLCEW